MLLKPDLIVKDVFSIDLASLFQQGIRGLLIDIDNTIVPWEKSVIDDSYITWIRATKSQGFGLCLVSNATEKRAQTFGELLEIPVVGRALKPLKRAFTRGLAHLQLEPAETAVIGDQIFTDVLGGNRLGLYTILTNPLSTEELGTTKLMRKLERKLLTKMAAKGQIDLESIRIRQGELE